MLNRKTSPKSPPRLPPLVLYRVDPHLGAMIGASRDRQIETVKSLFAFSKVPGGTRADCGMNFGEKLVVIGIVLPEHLDISFSAGNVNSLASGIIVPVVR